MCSYSRMRVSLSAMSRWPHSSSFNACSTAIGLIRTQLKERTCRYSSFVAPVSSNNRSSMLGSHTTFLMHTCSCSSSLRLANCSEMYGFSKFCSQRTPEDWCRCCQVARRTLNSHIADQNPQLLMLEKSEGRGRCLLVDRRSERGRSKIDGCARHSALLRASKFGYANQSNSNRQRTLITSFVESCSRHATSTTWPLGRWTFKITSLVDAVPKVL